MNDVVEIDIRTNKVAVEGEPLEFISLYEVWDKCNYSIPYYRWAKQIISQYNIKAVSQVIKTYRQGRNITGYYIPLEDVSPLIHRIKVRKHIDIVFRRMTDGKGELEVYEHDEYGRIYAVILSSQMWFVAASVIKIMGFSKESISLVSPEHKKKVSSTILGIDKDKNVRIVNEAGLYDLIFHSKGPRGRAVQDWMIEIVLPDLRGKIL